MEYSDGVIQSANLPTPRNTAKIPDYGLYRAMIFGFAYADDIRKNPTANAKTAEILYSVVILGGFKEGQLVTGVRLSKALGGKYNYHAQRLNKTTKPSGTSLKDHDGDIVYLQFTQGDTDYPIITSYGINPQDENKSSIRKLDGPSYRWQYNGIFEGIDKNGNLNLKIKGGKYDQAKDDFAPNADADTAIDVLFDPTKETYTRTFKTGLVVTEDGKNQKIDIDAGKGQAKVNVDGKNKKITITAGSTFVEIDGASGKIKLSGANVELGASISDFVTMFTELCSAFNTHTHTYAPGPGAPTPTTPPMAPLLSTVGSQTVKVQA